MPDIAGELIQDTFNRIRRLREEGRGSLRTATAARDELRRLTREIKLGHVNPTEGQRLRARVLQDVDAVRQSSDEIRRATERLEDIELGPKNMDGERPEEWKQEQYDDEVINRYPALRARANDSDQMDAIGGIRNLGQ